MNKNKQPLTRTPSSARRPPTSNYYRSGAKATATEDSPFRKKNKKSLPVAKFFTRFIDIIFIGSLGVGIIYTLLVNSTPRVQVNDTFYHSVDNYRDSSRGYMSTFKDRNKISFDETGVVKQLMLNYPEIDSASIELPVFAQRPIIRIKVAAPAFILNSNANNYLVDSNGKAIGLASNFLKATKLPVVKDQTNYPFHVGKNVVSSSDGGFIKSLIAESAKAGVKFDSLSLPTTPAELDAQPAGQSYIVRFYLAGNSEIEIGQFLAALHHFQTSSDKPSQYLDVRVSGKIYYK